MNTDAITTLVLIIDKYRQIEKGTNSYARHQVAKEVVNDLEKLKELMK